METTLNSVNRCRNRDRKDRVNQMWREPINQYCTCSDDCSTERPEANSEKERTLNHQYNVSIEERVAKERKPTSDEYREE
jgi:hypothetical protein